MARQTRAKAVRKEREPRGIIREWQQMLILHLRLRFGEPSKDTLDIIWSTRNLPRLTAWIRRCTTATVLAEIDIAAKAFPE
jgi:hypothetical protein